MSNTRQKNDPGTLTWNIVTKNFRAHEQLQGKLRQKLIKLESHLQRFPRDAVHLQVTLEKHSKRSLFNAVLRLRLPSTILYSEKQSADPVPALDQASKALLRQLADFKSKLRREPLWKRKERRAKFRAAKLLRFAAEPQSSGSTPQTGEDVVYALIEQRHGQLLRYVQRQLSLQADLAGVSRSAIDPRSVVDEVTRQVLISRKRKASGTDFLTWFYMLARQEIGRRIKALKAEAREALPLDEARLSAEDAEIAAGYEPEQPLDIIEQTLEPAVVENKSFVADPRATPPDESVVRQELLQELRKLTSRWPNPEKEAFELYFVEGLESDEIAMVLRVSTERAKGLVESVAGRIREALQTQGQL